MRQIYPWIAGSIVLVLLVAGLGVVAAGRRSATPQVKDQPAKVEHLEGSVPTRVTLTEDAAKRLDIQTARVDFEMMEQKQRQVIPYAAIIYDTEGRTWTYTNPAPLTFDRHSVSVDEIKGDLAILSEDLPAGTAVVTVGAEELYGSETEFQEE